MANSNKKRIKKTILCAGDLRHLVTIQTRTLTAVSYDSVQPVETFTTLREQYCAIETIGFPNTGVARFGSINLEDGATHIFWCMWAADFPDLENRNNFILYNDKRYKVIRVDNINELNTTLAIRTTERGEDLEEATKA